MGQDVRTDGLVVGVLGGMGPQATADFLAKLVAATPVDREQDHLRVRVDSNPKVPDRSDAITGRGPSPGPMLAAMAAGLERAGVDFLAMPCNTAHAFELEIRAAIGVPFISIVAEACAACERNWPAARRFGLLATNGCIAARLYQDHFALRGATAVTLAPDAQERFMALLYRIKLGDLSNAARAAMRDFGNALIDAGADVIVAGCTEVPLVLGTTDLARPVLDTTVELAQRCVRYALGFEPLPVHTRPLAIEALKH
ncbi:MAG TPA: amino acid racemase [Paraburkholderia sp.]|jgi:aspartate racemase|nr:amino acid racemase [Paraburkholderia sp.]